MDFEPGWLRKELDATTHALRVSHGPAWHKCNGLSAPIPLQGHDADELYKRLTARFFAWTGKDLATYKATP